MTSANPVSFELTVEHDSIRYYTHAVMESIPLVVHLSLGFTDGSVKQFYCCDNAISEEPHWVEDHHGITPWSASVGRALAAIPSNRFRELLESSAQAPDEMPGEPDF